MAVILDMQHKSLRPQTGEDGAHTLKGIENDQENGSSLSSSGAAYGIYGAGICTRIGGIVGSRQSCWQRSRLFGRGSHRREGLHHRSDGHQVGYDQSGRAISLPLAQPWLLFAEG